VALEEVIEVEAKTLRILDTGNGVMPVTVTQCGRVYYNRQKINLSRAFAGQKVGVKQVTRKVWLVNFMQFDLGYFDADTCRLEPIENPFATKVLPMCLE